MPGGRLGNPHGNGRDAIHGMGGQLQHAPGGAGAGGGGGGASGEAAAGGGGVDGALKQLAQANEKAWGTLGSVSRAMENDAQALESYKNALAHNPYSPSALAGLGGVYKARGDYRKVCARQLVLCNLLPVLAGLEL